MTDENDWLLEKQIKESDILNFQEWNNSARLSYVIREHTYKFRNFKKIFETKVRELIDGKLTELLKSGHINVCSNSWIDGIDCELLQDGLEKKGKIRLKVTVEFIPDDMGENSLTEGRSPLDDIRQISL